MRILVTGSSGWLGQTLVPRLSREGYHVVGMDLVPSPTTQIVGSVADRDLVRAIRPDPPGVSIVTKFPLKHRSARAALP
jgi:UDP-glucose 4-epimerase